MKHARGRLYYLADTKVAELIGRDGKAVCELWFEASLLPRLEKLHREEVDVLYDETNLQRPTFNDRPWYQVIGQMTHVGPVIGEPGATYLSCIFCSATGKTLEGRPCLNLNDVQHIRMMMRIKQEGA